ncbi:MAG TPA: MOSC and FAD-binding oxidoreductase domain-containing protein, partial [Blastocatellia bacterium]|nr:MOSC and FAD-binding oxidoreductase domain-containing protein [Blastocatellia bacterium]
KRNDFTYGQFGENFTIEGFPDNQVCIGDRYRIGTCLFEVTQPRVTCYRVGIRMNEPRMAALLTGSGRPGFYIRVLEEGEVGAGDEITKAGEETERMTVAEVNALLYSSDHPKEKLERALRLHALSPGWRWSFHALLESYAPDRSTSSGNAGLAPAAVAHTATPGFSPLKISRINRETPDVMSFSLEPTDSRSLTLPLPGQFIVLRLRPSPEGPATYRSYSLSGSPSAEQYRISVKIEPHGAAGTYLSTQVRTGDIIDASAPRGSFVLEFGDRPVVLLSGGIGVTPVLAMLHSLAAESSPREIWWIHTSRNRQSHPLAQEAQHLIESLPRGRKHIRYTRPEPNDQPGRDFDAVGRLSAAVLDKIGVPKNADFYLCGPTAFIQDLTAGLKSAGVSAASIHSEIFGGGESMTPGIAATASPAPHLPAGNAGDGPMVSFARSGITARWESGTYASLLEMAEACDVPVRWSCRTGVCHNCESGLVSGSVAYEPDPLDPPAAGNLLICCSRPKEDVVIDI